MRHFPDQAKERISEELATGNAAGVWAYALSHTDDPYFLPAVRELLRRQDVDDYTRYYAVRYLWNIGSPQAIEALQDAYDRKLMKAEPMFWMSLCEALAASGDGRGLPDAFDVLLDLKRPAEPPLDEQKRKDWENARDQPERGGRGRLRAGLESDPRRVPRPQVRRQLRRPSRRSCSGSSGGSRELPRRFAPVVPTWAEQPRPPGRRDGQAATRAGVRRG